MKYRVDEQYRRAIAIIDAVCKAGGVSYLDFLFENRSTRLNVIRGVAFYLSWEYGVHPIRMAALTRYSRSNIINQSKRYRWYIKTGDNASVELYRRTKEILEEELLKK